MNILDNFQNLVLRSTRYLEIYYRPLEEVDGKTDQEYARKWKAYCQVSLDLVDHVVMYQEQLRESLKIEDAVDLASVARKKLSTEEYRALERQFVKQLTQIVIE